MREETDPWPHTQSVEWQGLESGPWIPSTEFFASVAKHLVAHGLPKDQGVNKDSQVLA